MDDRELYDHDREEFLRLLDQHPELRDLAAPIMPHDPRYRVKRSLWDRFLRLTGWRT